MALVMDDAHPEAVSQHLQLEDRPLGVERNADTTATSPLPPEHPPRCLLKRFDRQFS
jgi:hypothetical protein